MTNQHFNSTLSSDPNTLNAIIRDTNLPTLSSTFKVKPREEASKNEKAGKKKSLLPKRRIFGAVQRQEDSDSEDDLNTATDMVLLLTSGGESHASRPNAEFNSTFSDTINTTLSSTMLAPLTQTIDESNITLETPPITPFHLARSWAPNVDSQNLNKLIPLTQSWNGAETTLDARKPHLLRSNVTSASSLQTKNHLAPSLSKVTSNVNKRQRLTLRTMQDFASAMHEDNSTRHNEKTSKKDSETAWDNELNQMRKQVRRLMKDMSTLAELHDNSDPDNDSGVMGTSKDCGASGDTKKGNLAKELKFRMPNKSISGLSKRLQKRILSLRANPAEMYSFKQEMEKLAEARRIAAKNRPKKLLTHVRNNMKNIDSQVLSKRINKHLEEHSQKLGLAKDKRLTIQEEQYLQKMNRFLEKQERIKEMSKFKSPAERVEAFQFNERQRAWWKNVALGVAFQRLHWALVQDRKTRIHTVTLNYDATEEERRAFTIHKRRLLMEIRNESQDNVACNPFISHIRYTLNRKHVAAHMVRQYLREQLKSKVIIGTIRNYKFCVIRAQRIVRNFLVCKRAQEKLLTLQFKKYELKRIENSKKQMLQELISIDSSMIANNHMLQRQVNAKRQQLVNEEETFATVPKEIRTALVRQSIRRRRLAYVRQQVEWDRKIRLFREERRKAGSGVDDLPMLITRPSFCVLLSPRDINELIALAEQKSTEQGRDLTLRRSLEKNTLARKHSPAAGGFQKLRRMDSGLNPVTIQKKKKALSRIRSMQRVLDG